MSSCFILPNDFEEKKNDFLEFLGKTFEEEPANPETTAETKKKGFNTNLPSIFASQIPKDYSEPEYFVTFSTKSIRFQKDSNEQWKSITNKWDKLKEKDKENKEISIDVEIRTRRNRIQKNALSNQLNPKPKEEDEEKPREENEHFEEEEIDESFSENDDDDDEDDDDEDANLLLTSQFRVQPRKHDEFNEELE